MGFQQKECCDHPGFDEDLSMTSNFDDPYSIHSDGGKTPATENALVKALGDHPFLKDLTEDQLNILSANAMPVDIPANEIIFSEGDAANRFYLIQEGEVVLESVDSPEKSPVEISRLGAGDVLGWSWMFPPFYWRFSARAIQPTKAIFFYGTRLREEAEKDPRLGMALAHRAAEVAIQRLQTTRKKLLALQKKQN